LRSLGTHAYPDKYRVYSETESSLPGHDDSNAQLI
jgi:hypothetical protein